MKQPVFKGFYQYGTKLHRQYQLWLQATENRYPHFGSGVCNHFHSLHKNHHVIDLQMIPARR